MKNMNIPAGLLLLALAIFILWSGNHQPAVKYPPVQETSSGAAAIGGNFTLTDQNGHTIHAADFRGKLMLVYFGYTHCPDICPVSVAGMSKAMDLLGAKADQVAPLFITVDPARDTPAVLKDYLSNFNKHMIGLTGTPEQIKAVAADYKAYFARQGAPQDEEKPGQMGAHKGNSSYPVNHSGYIYLMDKNGKYLQLFQYNASPSQIAGAINAQLK